MRVSAYSRLSVSAELLTAGTVDDPVAEDPSLLGLDDDLHRVLFRRVGE